MLKGLAREDLFTVVHERFLTDTARYADIVLPATSSLEHSDIYRAYGTYCIQRAKPAIEPIGESRSNWEVFSLLAAGARLRGGDLQAQRGPDDRPAPGHPFPAARGDRPCGRWRRGARSS